MLSALSSLHEKPSASSMYVHFLPTRDFNLSCETYFGYGSVSPLLCSLDLSYCSDSCDEKDKADSIVFIRPRLPENMGCLVLLMIR